MINPNGDDFVQDDPLAGSINPSGQQISAGSTRFQDTTEKVSAAAGDAWRQTKATANTAREKTEFLLRENPVPTVIGALAIGLAIGLAIRYSSERSEPEPELKTPFGDVNLGLLSLPFLWPFLQDGATPLRRFGRCGQGWRRSVEKRGCRPLREAASEEVAFVDELGL